MDDDKRSLPRAGAMFTTSSVAKADLATNLAIQLLADGGWSAVTLRNVARAGNVTPQAIAAWFPSVSVMRAAVAGRYGERWIRMRSYQAHDRLFPLLRRAEAVPLPELAQALMPATWQEEAFAGVWLTIVEASRWDDGLAPIVASMHAAERDLVLGLLSHGACRDEDQLELYADLVLTLVQGLCSARTSSRAEAMSTARADEVLRAALSGDRT